MDELTKELCYIYHQRNLLGKERDRLRYKYNYLKDIKRAIQVRSNFNSSEVSQTVKRMSSELEKETYIAAYKKRNPVPKRFKDTTLSDINIMLLDAEAAVCKIKIKVMKHTRKYQKRVAFLMDATNISPSYTCGIVRCLTYKYTKDIPYHEHRNPISQSDMKKYHDEVLASKAIHKMLAE